MREKCVRMSACMNAASTLMTPLPDALQSLFLVSNFFFTFLKAVKLKAFEDLKYRISVAHLPFKKDIFRCIQIRPEYIIRFFFG